MQISLRLPVPFSGQTPWARVTTGAAISSMSVHRHFQLDIIEPAPQRARNFAPAGHRRSIKITATNALPTTGWKPRDPYLPPGLERSRNEDTLWL